MGGRVDGLRRERSAKRLMGRQVTMLRGTFSHTKFNAPPPFFPYQLVLNSL